jgi:hypothetical protein
LVVVDDQLRQGLIKVRRAEVGVYLGSGQLGMAHEISNGIEVHAGHDQVAGEGMPEIVQAAGETGPGGRTALSAPLGTDQRRPEHPPGYRVPEP